LIGSIPSSIGQLKSLVNLYLGFNYLTNTIPSSLQYLQHLGDLYLNHNLITGTLPPELGNIITLIDFEVDNSLLSGTIPSTYINLINLEYFSINNNHFTGTLPYYLFNYTNLIQMYVGNNQFSGTLPSNLKNLKALQILSFYRNLIEYTIPSTINEMNNLRYLDLGRNLFTGYIPASITTMINLKYLYLNRNLLSGSLPANIGDIKLLHMINLNHNILESTLPSSLSLLYYLELLSISNNQLKGSITSIFNSTNQIYLYTIQLSDNQLTGFLPKEMYLLKNLTSLALVNNCFETINSINDVICNSTTLQSLALDGLHASPSCRRNILPSFISSSYVLQSSSSSSTLIHQNIPSCLFNMSNLLVLHLSGNGYTGYLPSEDIYTSSSSSLPPSSSVSYHIPKLLDLSVSHNIMIGTIPISFQKKPWFNLDISHNRFNGILINDIGGNNVINISIYNNFIGYYYISTSQILTSISYQFNNNRLSGYIPLTLFNSIHNISIITGNIYIFCVHYQHVL